MLLQVLRRSAFVALVLTAVVAASAHAGKYHVYACRMPSGEVAPVDGWSSAKTGSGAVVENTCSTGGALIAALSDEPERTANTTIATWALEVPAPEKVTGTTLWRAGDSDGGAAVSAFYEFWFSGPSNILNPEDAFAICEGGFTGCPVGTTSEPLSSANRLAVPTANLGAHLYMNASCVGESGFKCSVGVGDEHGDATIAHLYATNLILEQNEGPLVSGVSGPLATEPTIHGTSDVVFTATDPGAGVYQAVFTVDGHVVQETVVNENGGRCHNVGQTTDGLPAFLYLQPCVKSIDTDIGLDTTKLSNGVHHVVVSVADPAGNSAPVLDREVEVFNTFPPEFRWKVNGAALGEGASKELTTKAAKAFVLKGKASGVAVKLESSKLKAVSGAAIAGGTPGTSKETLKLEEVSVSKPAHCEVKEKQITTKPLIGEIVESAVEEAKTQKGTEKAELRLAPKEGTTFAEVEFVGAECTLKGTVALLDGSTVTEVLPQKEEAEAIKLELPKTKTELSKSSKGGFQTAELTIGGKVATLTGEAELTLVSKEKFGAF